MPLMRALNRADLDDALRARLVALRDAIAAEAAPKLTALLNAEPDPLAREAALTHLARQPGPFAAVALVALLRAGDVGLRNAAIETLAALGERALQPLAEALADDDADTRIFALTALERIDHPAAAEMALAVALRDEDVNVCAAAVEVVAQTGVARMAETLRQVVARFPDSPFMAFAAETALQRLA